LGSSGEEERGDFEETNLKKEKGFFVGRSFMEGGRRNARREISQIVKKTLIGEGTNYE